MDVGVGNFSDEVDMPGMAHAVEHVSLQTRPSGCPTKPRLNQLANAHHTAASVHGHKEISIGE
jgi:hypothetical protein